VPGPKGDRGTPTTRAPAATAGGVTVPDPRPRPTDTRDGRAVKPANPPNPRNPGPKRVVTSTNPRDPFGQQQPPTPRPRPTDIATSDGIRVPTPRVRPPRSRGDEIVKAVSMPVRPAVKTPVVVVGARPNPTAKPQPTPRPRPTPKPAAPAARPAPGRSGAESLFRAPQYRPQAQAPLSRAQLKKLYDEYYRLPADSPRRKEIDDITRRNKHRYDVVD
jgi:hypothetical protein